MVDDPYQTMTRYDLENNNITNIELDHVTFKNDGEGTRPRSKGNFDDLARKPSRARTGFGSRADSGKLNFRSSSMMRDYKYKPSDKKRFSCDTRKIITIYENDPDARHAAEMLRPHMRRKHKKQTSKKHKFLSNRSLLGVQHNTKELTRMMNTSGYEPFRGSNEFNKTMPTVYNARPKTTQSVGRKHRKKMKKHLRERPSTQGNTKNTTMNQFSQKVSIFDQNKMMPEYNNFAITESPSQTGQNCHTTITKNRSLRSISPEKSYKRLRNRILENMKVQKQTPNLLNENCKTFYWSPDMSFCAFATEKQIKKTAQLWRKNRRIDSGQRMDYVLHGSGKYKSMLKNVANIPQITQELGL